MKNKLIVAIAMAGLSTSGFVSRTMASVEMDQAQIESADLVSQSIQEIQDTMTFFESWWQGEAQKSAAEYRLAERGLLAPDFTFVTPDGMTLDRDMSLAGLYEQHGARKDLVKIEDLNFKVILADKENVVISYDEHQTIRDSRTGSESTLVLVTTSVFRRNRQAPNGVAWVRVQETVRR